MSGTDSDGDAGSEKKKKKKEKKDKKKKDKKSKKDAAAAEPSASDADSDREGRHHHRKEKKDKKDKKKKEKEKKRKASADDGEELPSSAACSDEECWHFGEKRYSGPKKQHDFCSALFRHLRHTGGGDMTVEGVAMGTVVSAYRANFERRKWDDGEVARRWEAYVRRKLHRGDADSRGASGSPARSSEGRATPPTAPAGPAAPAAPPDRAATGGLSSPADAQPWTGEEECSRTAIHITQPSSERLASLEDLSPKHVDPQVPADDVSVSPDNSSTANSPAQPSLAGLLRERRAQQPVGAVAAATVSAGAELAPPRALADDAEARRGCSLQRTLAAGGSALRARVAHPDCSVRYSLDAIAPDTLLVCFRCVGVLTYCATARIPLCDRVLSAEWEACQLGEVLPPGAWQRLRDAGWSAHALGPESGGCAFPDATGGAQHDRELLRLRFQKAPDVLLLFSLSHIGCVAEVDVSPPPPAVRCHYVGPVDKVAEAVQRPPSPAGGRASPKAPPVEQPKTRV
eukprot:TRINITY_DN13249_c0_g1_i1.p2 TRINITY_DN13249_c0_g1~~TRINITY_DN13249_c0_g1_i1.p2  ORF type:complete len:515 (+),score=165.17 TRINITY_DN13249_c0_g1_i1:88-1632(+)